MIQYIYRDMVSMLRFLPYGILIGIPVSAVLVCVSRKVGKSKGKEPAALLPVIVFGMYFALMMVITFLSRESGDSNGLDLRLFSTWGINKRNNAFVVENILLFIPYGFFGCWASRRLRRFLPSLALGGGTSLGIELLQLITGRGFFQIDDIITNILGTIIGFLFFKILPGPKPG